MKSPFKKSWIIIHHSLVSYDKNSDQFDAIARYHKSKGWGSIGYQYVLSKNGTIKIGRIDNEVGAHCKEKMMNYRSIGICLSGNFDEEHPTEEQILQLKNLVARLRKEYNIPEDHVVGHRYFANYKSCPGVLFTDSMIKNIAQNKNNDQMASTWAFDAWKEMVDNRIMTKDPRKPITKEELAVVIQRLKSKKYLK